MAKIRFLLVEPSADKPTPLFAFLSFNGRRIKVYSGRSIHPKQWDGGEQKARTKGYSHNGAINDWLTILGQRLTDCYDTHTAAGTLPSAEELRTLALFEDTTPQQLASAPEPAGPDFFTIFATWIESKALTQSPNTLRTYRTSLRHLRDLQQVEGYAVDFATVGNGFAERYARYLLTKRNLVDSAVHKVHKNLFRLKHFLTWAIDNGYPVVADPKKFSWQHRHSWPRPSRRDASTTPPEPTSHLLTTYTMFFNHRHHAGLSQEEHRALPFVSNTDLTNNQEPGARHQSPAQPAGLGFRQPLSYGRAGARAVPAHRPARALAAD